jgi:hypothetical protein
MPLRGASSSGFEELAASWVNGGIDGLENERGIKSSSAFHR